MSVSSNKLFDLNLKGNEALTGISTKYTGHSSEFFNPKKFEKEVKTSVLEIFDSKNTYDEKVNDLENSIFDKKSDSSNSLKSGNSDISGSENEENIKIYTDQINLNKKNSFNNDINKNGDDAEDKESNDNDILKSNIIIDNPIINNNITIGNNINNGNNSNNIITKNSEPEFPRLDNTIKELLKKPMNSVKRVIEEIIKKKLVLNLDKVFGSSIKQNRAALDLCIYEILCINKKNKIILEKVISDNSIEKKELFYYILKKKFSFFYEKYINNQKEFVINGKKYVIENFKTFNEVLKEKKEKKISEINNIGINIKNDNNDNIINKKRKRKPYNKNISEEKIKKFEKYSKNFLKYINSGFLDERKKKQKNKFFFVIKTIDELEDLIEKENET